MRFMVDYKIDHAVPHMEFDKRLRRNLLYTMRLFSKRTTTVVRKKLLSGKYASNSPPWMAAKDGGRSLYHTGHLSTTLRASVIGGMGNDYVYIRVGWLEDTPHPRSGIGMQKLVGWLTGVQEWEPRRSQVKAFWAKIPKEWKDQNSPLFRQMWRSPHKGKARNFLKDVIADPQILLMVRKYSRLAYQRTVAGK